jgi:hypothetical protein
MAAKWFRNDEVGYLEWCRDHPNGFVVNTRQKMSRNYIVLHRATCPTITIYSNMAENPGGFTERQYSKCCAESVTDLLTELRRQGMGAEPISKTCRCSPKALALSAWSKATWRASLSCFGGSQAAKRYCGETGSRRTLSYKVLRSSANQTALTTP